MKVNKDELNALNESQLPAHRQNFNAVKTLLSEKAVDADEIIEKLIELQIAIPSWALGTGGTRFGRFPGGGEPGNLEDKISDVGLLHALNRSSGAISLHIPWDIPENAKAIQNLAQAHDLVFDAVNSNTFQDQPEAEESYKFGSLCHTDKKVRDMAVAHNKAVIDHGKALGSKSLTVWLADGSSFPGQSHFRTTFENTLASLKEIYDYLPEDWKMFIEYKPYEPNFYAMAIPDWGTSHMLASKLGEKALCLVDLGHHLPNTNIEQIVSILMMENKLGGFHFNDSKYGDDDLTVGCLKPYQLFLIFTELVDGMQNTKNPPLSWMIDASHNLKDPLEDLLQSIEAIFIAYAQALIVDTKRLRKAQANNDVAEAQEILQDAFRTDVRPLLAEARLRDGGALNPLKAYRHLKVRSSLIEERGEETIATGL